MHYRVLYGKCFKVLNNGLLLCLDKGGVLLNLRGIYLHGFVDAETRLLFKFRPGVMA